MALPPRAQFHQANGELLASVVEADALAVGDAVCAVIHNGELLLYKVNYVRYPCPDFRTVIHSLTKQVIESLTDDGWVTYIHIGNLSVRHSLVADTTAINVSGSRLATVDSKQHITAGICAVNNIKVLPPSLLAIIEDTQ